VARIKFDETSDYLHSLVPGESAMALKAKAEAQRLHKDTISISAYEAHLMSFFIRICQCSRFVELGTLTGYSGLKILETLPSEGYLWTFELNPEFARFAATLFDEAGFRGRYTILVGKAEELLPTISSFGPFDGVFIDANKSSYPFYLEWSFNNLKPGGLLLADNTLMSGVADANLPTPEKMIRELRVFNQRFMQHPGLNAMMIPTREGLSVGIKK
jgi:predicted O-methyltransferase YrrM